MRPAAQLIAGLLRFLGAERGLVTAVVIHHQVALPCPQKLSAMCTASPVPVIEDNDARPRLQVIATVGPQVGFLGFAPARVKLRNRRFIGMQGVTLQQVPSQAVGQGLQRYTQLANPVSQC